MTLTTGELSEGPGSWALASKLYSSRRMVNVPFSLEENCEEEREETYGDKMGQTFLGGVAENLEDNTFIHFL